MEEKVDIKRLIAALPDDNADRRLMDYVHAIDDVGVRREVVQELEREIKCVAGNEDNSKPDFRHLNTDEDEKLWMLLLNRNSILDSMMAHPTVTEVARLRSLNDRLYRLTLEVYENTRRAWRMLRHSPYKVNDRFAYELDGSMTFAYNDHAVLRLDNDDFYGSDFQYMLHLQAWYIANGHTSHWLDACTDVFSNFLSNEDEAMKEMDAAFLDDGTSWNEGVFRNKAFDDIVICHAIHGLWDHQGYAGPDILRMDNFKIKIALTYEDERCDGRETREDDDDFEYASRWEGGKFD